MLNNIVGLLAAAPSLNSYESIQTITVGSSGQSSISFTDIPATYKHLQLRAFFKTDSVTWVPLKLNGDSSNGRTSHFLRGNGTAASAGVGLASTSEGNYAVLSEPSQWGSAIVDVLDYASTNKLKTSRILSGFDGNGSGNVVLASVLHVNNSTTAVTSLGFDITQYTSGIKFVEYSHFALYGIKG
jgi:hypothetical protein